MTALATSADVEAELGRTLTASEALAVGVALDRASGLVRAETGRFFAAGTYTVERKVRCGKVRLDNATSVTGVVVANSDGTTTAVTGYTLRRNTVYGLGCDKTVEITYVSAGTVPADIVDIVAAIAARSITAVAPEGAESFTVTAGPFNQSGTFSESFSATAATAVELLVMRRYAARRVGPVTEL